MNDGIYAYKNGKYNPDYDMFCWGWAGDYDPGFLLSLLTSVADRGLERHRLVERRVRPPLRGAGQRARPRQAPRARAPDAADHLRGVPVHRDRLPAVCGRSTTREHWTGWTRSRPTPAASTTAGRIWNVEPKAGATADEGGAKGVVIAVVIVGGHRRRRRRVAAGAPPPRGQARARLRLHREPGVHGDRGRRRPPRRRRADRRGRARADPREHRVLRGAPPGHGRHELPGGGGRVPAPTSSARAAGCRRSSTSWRAWPPARACR